MKKKVFGFKTLAEEQKVLLEVEQGPKGCKLKI
jgi:cold shock CspA family protein